MVSAPQPGFARTARDLLAWFGFLIAAIGLAVRFVPIGNHGILVLAALSPYLTTSAGLAAGLLLLRNRRRWAAATTLAVAAAGVAVQIPRLVPANSIDGVAVRVVTLNLRESEADMNAVVALARSRADLFVVQELTPAFARGLSELSSDFPHRVLDTNDSPGGVGIWSRYRLANSIRISGYQLGMLSATVTIPGTASDVVVLGAHVVGPWPQAIDGWKSEIELLPRTLDDAAQWAGAGAVIVAGDFNATADMLPFRQLLRSGYRDAAAQSGTGLNPTFPADSSIPPLIGIDHILTRNSSASGMRTVKVPGTDHLAVVATVHIPR